LCSWLLPEANAWIWGSKRGRFTVCEDGSRLSLCARRGVACFEEKGEPRGRGGGDLFPGEVFLKKPSKKKRKNHCIVKRRRLSSSLVPNWGIHRVREGRRKGSRSGSRWRHGFKKNLRHKNKGIIPEESLRGGEEKKAGAQGPGHPMSECVSGQVLPTGAFFGRHPFPSEFT